ncbi:MAG: uracil-DNA glycosylase [bacterium]|nr:uracil-DNA glycosylase [bacterium]
MAIDATVREYLLLHLERLQQAYGRERTLAVQVRASAAPAEPEPPRFGAGRSGRTPPQFGRGARPQGQQAVPGQESGPAQPQPAPGDRPTAAAPAAAATPAATPTPSPAAAANDPLAALRAETTGCEKCKLCERRQNVVFGEGDPNARVMFIGEAPGANEDRTGRPFVGAAGQLLDRIISNAMAFERSEVYIANINKCRPPNNREPQPDEVASCLPFLREQIRLIQPAVLVCLGRVAAQNLLGRKESATKLRAMELAYDEVPVVVTWHPAYLLREPSRKRETWEDIKRVNRLLGRPEVPPKKS